MKNGLGCILPNLSREHFSTTVSLKLIVAGREIVLSHLGPDYMIVRENDVPITEEHGKLVVRVDSSCRGQDVVLPQGVPAGRFRQVAYW